ncbi:intradiol ring-cleavage dioxygenase [Streptomyces sp. NRRL S-1022]|uniref:intradiol ring-cleavage dioxygenase n=1 Tax=Streptomyces sp. NRRL S-1022 TaxID=1463880 RepID=UPI00099DCF55|nr:intradiol ring-cleavage dioxygenase [Streptomyces sp. NRRL S-1022]
MTDTPHPHSAERRRNPEQADGPGGASRRTVIAALGGATLGAAALGLTAGQATAAADRKHAAQAPARAAADCVLTPEQTEGPYYLDLETVRKNITEGKAGVPLTLRVKVIDTATCAALPGTAVDIWHCDALGVYSGYAAGGSTPDTTFLRGVQLTDSAGVAEFTTVYPGWYVGRALHIHVKTHAGGTVADGRYRGGHVSHTGQLYFPETYNSRIATLAPYRRNTATRTLNARDGIYRNGGSATLLTLTQNGSDLGTGVTGTVVLGIDPDAVP